MTVAAVSRSPARVRGRVEGKEEEGDRRAERRTERVSERVQDGAGGGGEREHGEGRPASGDEREGGERGQDDAERIEVACVLRGTTRREQRERENEHGCGDARVEEKLSAVHVPRVTARTEPRVSPQEDPAPPVGGRGNPPPTALRFSPRGVVAGRRHSYRRPRQREEMNR